MAVEGTVTRQFYAPTIICPLNAAHGLIEPIEEEWLNHFCLLPIGEGGHEGIIVPTAMPHIEVSGNYRATERLRYKCRIPGCTAYFPAAVLLKAHLIDDHGCT